MPAPAELDRILNAYNIIGVTPDSSALRIKRAYWRLAKRWHPDKQGSHGTRDADNSERMREINEAYNLIRHAPLRYQSTSPANVSTRAKSPPNYVQKIDALEYTVRIVAGLVVGALASFIWLLNDAPIAMALILPLATAAASAIYGDAFWRWILKYGLLW